MQTRRAPVHMVAIRSEDGDVDFDQLRRKKWVDMTEKEKQRANQYFTSSEKFDAMNSRERRALLSGDERREGEARLHNQNVKIMEDSSSILSGAKDAQQSLSNLNTVATQLRDSGVTSPTILGVPLTEAIGDLTNIATVGATTGTAGAALATSLGLGVTAGSAVTGGLALLTMGSLTMKMMEKYRNKAARCAIDLTSGGVPIDRAAELFSGNPPEDLKVNTNGQCVDGHICARQVVYAKERGATVAYRCKQLPLKF